MHASSRRTAGLEKPGAAKESVMNPRERMLAALKGRPVDRVPLLLLGFHDGFPQQTDDPGKREILSRMGEHLHFLYECPSQVNRYLVTPPQRLREVKWEEGNGKTVTTTVIDTPRGPLTAVTERNHATDTVWTLKYPVETLEDIAKLQSVPWELPAGLEPPDLSSLPGAFATRGIVHSGVSSPFVCVAGMMRYERFLELCATELNLLRELTQLCLDRILDVLDVLLSQNSVEWVWMGGCEWVTPPMGSNRVYDELVQPFERRVIERVHAGGALSHVHCHGNVRSTLARVIERGADYFEPVEPPPDGDVSFAEAKELADGRITLGGNIEARLLEHEEPEVVEKAARNAFEGGKARMVLQTTAEPLARMTSRMVENYHRMLDVWEELSPA